MLVDSHAHIHFDEYRNDINKILANAKRNSVSKIIIVGTDGKTSAAAIEFIKNLNNPGIKIFASIGLHPHDAKKGLDDLKIIKNLAESENPVAIGECGLDYYRNLSSKDEQIKVFRYQIELALSRNLPIIFHVRDGFDDFFKIIKDYDGIKGVIHSFSATKKEVELGLKYDLYFGLNGIMTFTKDQQQLEAAKVIPRDKLLLETDCPFLSPAPYRGKRNEPAFVKVIAQFLAELRNQNFDELAQKTSQNAKTLFNLI